MDIEQVQNQQETKENTFKDSHWNLTVIKIKNDKSLEKISCEKDTEHILSKRKNPYQHSPDISEQIYQNNNKKCKDGEKDHIVVQINKDERNQYHANLEMNGKILNKMNDLEKIDGSTLNQENEQSEQIKSDLTLKEFELKVSDTRKKQQEKIKDENSVTIQSKSVLNNAFIEGVNEHEQSDQMQKSETEISNFSILEAINEEEQEVNNNMNEEKYDQIDKDQEEENEFDSNQNQFKVEKKEGNIIISKPDFDNNNQIKENGEAEQYLEELKREKDDQLVKNEIIEVKEAIIDEDLQGLQLNIQQQMINDLNNMNVNISNEGSILTIKIQSREYEIDQTKECFQKNERLQTIINEIIEYKDQIELKQNQKDLEILKISNHNQYSAIEYSLNKTIKHILKDEKNVDDKNQQEEICSICGSFLFQNIDSYTKKDFLNQLQIQSDNDPIILQNCESHFFHKMCVKNIIQQNYFKCTVCSKVYGIMTGDQPAGSMNIYLDKEQICERFPNHSTIVILLKMDQTEKDGIDIPQKNIIGYLPNSEEGRKILEILKIAFKRRLLLTVDKHEQTGQENTIILNGIHLKTNITGGETNNGYPDPNYFEKITEELQQKGINVKN